jgi:hypothetical protein
MVRGAAASNAIGNSQKKPGQAPWPSIAENDGEVRHFAKRFKAYLESNFKTPTLQEYMESGSKLEGQFNDGTPYRVVAKESDAVVPRTGIVFFPSSVVLPNAMEFVNGIYSAGDIDCGRETLIRSLYGETGARLRERSVVLRWLHVEKDLVAENRCILYGRASAEQSMRIGAGSAIRTAPRQANHLRRRCAGTLVQW